MTAEVFKLDVIGVAAIVFAPCKDIPDNPFGTDAAQVIEAPTTLEVKLTNWLEAPEQRDCRGTEYCTLATGSTVIGKVVV
jgi:hypothetical protein